MLMIAKRPYINYKRIIKIAIGDTFKLLKIIHDDFDNSDHYMVERELKGRKKNKILFIKDKDFMYMVLGEQYERDNLVDMPFYRVV